jgi:hypothetical protein
MHGHSHVFDHILSKGVVLNYSTKLFERLHGPLKTWYLLRTNFKNIAPQVCHSFSNLTTIRSNLYITQKILRADHHMLTSVFIRGQINALHDQDEDTEISDIQDLHEVGSNAIGLFGNVSLGAAQPSCTFRELEQSHQQDTAFARFRLRFRDFLDVLLRQPNSPIKIQHNHPLSINAEQLVSKLQLAFIMFIMSHASY